MRSHLCGEINETLDGQSVTLCGWVDRRRDLGGLIFISLRDRAGIVQVVVEPDSPAFADAEQLMDSAGARILCGHSTRSPWLSVTNRLVKVTLLPLVTW